MMRLLLTALAMLILTTASTQALLLNSCGLHDQMVEHLKSRYQEQVVGDGLNSSGAIIELLVSPSGSFTLLKTNTNGWTCVIGAGDAWQKIEPVVGEPA